MTDQKPVILHVSTGGIVGRFSMQFLMTSRRAALKAQRDILSSAKAWEARTNDREKFVSFRTSSGPAHVNVEGLTTVSINDSFVSEQSMRALHKQLAKVEDLSDD